MCFRCFHSNAKLFEIPAAVKSLGFYTQNKRRRKVKASLYDSKFAESIDLYLQNEGSRKVGSCFLKENYTFKSF